MNEPLFIIVDLFCGAGGTTTGFAKAILEGNEIAKVIACVNHDPKAIKSHWLNHPDVKHFEEDIRTLDLTGLIKLVAYYRAKYPNSKLILWASLECTNFSRAKGGQPRNADSRTLADYLDRYIIGLDPDYIQIENVIEFRSWGPLNEHGKPISSKSGSDWMRWRKNICSLGYYDEWQEMNSANYGSYTSRNRLFGCFAKQHLPICFPAATHTKNPTKKSMYGDLKKWNAVKEVLDFTNEGISIFNRKKPLVDKSLKRIYAGLIKFVANGDTSFLSKYYSGFPSDKNISIEGPAGSVTTVDHHSLVQASFITQRNGGNPDSKIISVEGPSRTLTATGGNQELIQANFLSSYYGHGSCSSIADPAPTITTKDRLSLIQLSKAQNQSINEPAGTITTNDKHRLVEAVPFLMPTNFDNSPKSINDPAPVITADKHATYIVNPSHGGHCTSSDAPCPVIVARQDKAPLSVVMCESGHFQISIYDTDSEIMVKIKQFMAAYNIVDIKMRMLTVYELLRIQGFPSNYQLFGNQADKKKFIGNSVEPVIPKVWAEALAKKNY